MPIKYKVQPIKSPKTGEIKYYAVSDTRYQVGFETLAGEIEKLTSLTAGDALNMLRTMQYLIIQHLSNNDTVKFDQLGTFMATIRSEPSDKEEDVSASKIKSVHVRFLKGANLIKEFQKGTISFVAGPKNMEINE